MGTRNSDLKRLAPREFDAELLERLTNEGRVFIKIPRISETEVYKREVLDYVGAIAEYATMEWQDRICDLWQTIVDAADLSEYLVMKRGVHTGHMNRYAVTNLICRMQNKGVYRTDVPMLTLHLRLEGTKTKNKYYQSCGNYSPTSAVRKALNKILSVV